MTTDPALSARLLALASDDAAPGISPSDIAFNAGVARGTFQMYQAALESVGPGFRFSSDRRLARFLLGETGISEKVAAGVSVSIERNEAGAFDVRVNWSAIGDVVPERAEAFAADLQAAARRASVLRDVLRALPADFSPEFLSFVAEKGLPTV